MTSVKTIREKNLNFPNSLMLAKKGLFHSIKILTVIERVQRVY